MTIQQENALLRRALLEAAAADFAAEAPEIPQSFRQEKRMRAMLADPFGYAKRVRRPWWRQFVHTAAMVAVALGMSIALLAALSPSVRAAIQQWFLEIRNSDIVYYFTGETKGGELPYYTITDLPEGYEQTNVVEGPFSAILPTKMLTGKSCALVMRAWNKEAVTALKQKGGDFL